VRALAGRLADYGSVMLLVFLGAILIIGALTSPEPTYNDMMGSGRGLFTAIGAGFLVLAWKFWRDIRREGRGSR
jgi:hypothetical protein